MKTKSKEKKLIECGGAFRVEQVSKYTSGWSIDTSQASSLGASPSMSLFPFVEGGIVQVGISKPDFDSIQPGDQIKFFAVVIKPRNKRVKKAAVLTTQEAFTAKPNKLDGIELVHVTPAIKEGAAWK